MKRLLWWGLGITVGLWVANQFRGTRTYRRLVAYDLNHCSREQLLSIPGVDESDADRIIENRPYRHRLDLVARMVVPSGVYQGIRDYVDVPLSAARSSINVAS